MEYYEYGDLASAKLRWVKSETTLPNQFEAQYYPNSYLLGEPLLERIDPSINFNWQLTSPLAADSDEGDNFSARWTGMVNFEKSGTYEFTATCDDGCRVWVGNELLINAWKAQASTTYTKSITLTAGEHRVIMEYQEFGGAAVAKLRWNSL